MAGYDHTNVAFGRVADPTTYNALGQYVDRLSKSVIGWGQRITASSTTTSEVGVLRVDGLAIKAGDIYHFWSSPLILRSDTAGTEVVANLRINVSGVAVIGSTQLTTAFDIAGGTWPANTNAMTQQINFLYQSASDQVASLLITVAKFNGADAGNVLINAGASIPIQLVCEWIGADPGNTGVAV
jgi:hypothetical protein